MNRNNPPHGVHPNVIKQQYDVHNVWGFENHWHQALCTCKPMSRCCFACFCACCMNCMVASRLGETGAIGCFPCSVCYLRTKLRTARRIEGGCCSDWCTSQFCCPCVTTQIASELESQGMWDQDAAKRNRSNRR